MTDPEFSPAVVPPEEGTFPSAVPALFTTHQRPEIRCRFGGCPGRPAVVHRSFRKTQRMHIQIVTAVFGVETVQLSLEAPKNYILAEVPQIPTAVCCGPQSRMIAVPNGVFRMKVIPQKRFLFAIFLVRCLTRRVSRGAR